MSDEKKIEDVANEYGNDTALPIIRSMYPSKSRGAMKEEFASAFKSGVQWRDENPSDELEELRTENAKLKRTNERLAMNYQELKELRNDKARLDWMIENSAMINKSRNIFYCEIIDGGAVRSYGEITPREAIDAARAESGRG